MKPRGSETQLAVLHVTDSLGTSVAVVNSVQLEGKSKGESERGLRKLSP